MDIKQIMLRIAGSLVTFVISVVAALFLNKEVTANQIEEYNTETRNEIEERVYKQMLEDIENGSIILSKSGDGTLALSMADSGSEADDASGNTNVSALSNEAIQKIVDRVLSQSEKYGLTDLSADQKTTLTRDITKSIAEQLTSLIESGTFSTIDRNSIINEVTERVKSSVDNTISESAIRDIVRNVVDSMNIQGEKGDKGEAGKDGKDGKDGTSGSNGNDGKTPVRGVDYFTQSDIDSMVNSVTTEVINAGDIIIAAKTAYDLAVEHGFEGTEEEWLDSLRARLYEEEDGTYTLVIPADFMGEAETD